MEAEWHVSQVASLVGITTFTSGFAIGPMFLAPFSEIYGRKPVFIATAILFAICQVCCAVTRLYSGYVRHVSELIPLAYLLFLTLGFWRTMQRLTL